jgi:DNA repair exonuclease SbcCD ATPase subunit
MRIKKLELNGFRAFAQTQSFDLDADVIIVSGGNGQGKTSFLDGVMWAITGSIPRLGDDDQHLVSMYSDSGEARVALELKTSSNETCRLTRTYDGERQHLRIEINGEVFRDTNARSRIMEMFWPQELTTPDDVIALTGAFTRTTYLQQDLVRQFVESDSDQDRFNTVSELIGAGKVTELQTQVDRAKTAWTRATNVRREEGEASRRRLLNLERQLTSLSRDVSRPDQQEIKTAWYGWWNRADQLGVSIPRQVPQPDSVDAPPVLDTAVKQLETLRRSNSRRRDIAAALHSEILAKPDLVAPDEGSVRDALENAQGEVRLAREALTAAERRAAQERHAQVQLRESREELRVLAQLALRHLGERCPVCAQHYDHAETRRRLEELAGAPAEKDLVVSGAEQVVEMAALLEDRERTLSMIEARHREVQDTNREWRSWIADRDRRLQELGLIEPHGGAKITQALQRLVNELDAAGENLAGHQGNGERLALMLAQTSERARRVELKRELNAVRHEVDDLDESTRSREQTGDLAAQMLDGLREAASDLVKVRLEGIEPLLQRIYARIDPHPTFRVVRLLARYWHGRGRLTTEIIDQLGDRSTELPSVVLSSSQMNALAVAVFLAFNLAIPAPALRTVMLDDPLQSLDDVNLLGLIDLIRRTKDRRQLLISTHDSRFARLLERKMRPVRRGQRTLVVEFDGWGRNGPVVSQREIALDDTPIRIVA